MAIPVLLILAVLWAAVLVPPVLRSRSESRRRGTVGDFTSRLGAVTGRSTSRRSKRARPSLPAVPTLRYGSARPGGPAGHPSRGPRSNGNASRPIASGAPAPMTRAQKRRRDVLITLGGTAIATLLLSLVLGHPLLWLVQALVDVLLVVYVILVLLLQRRGALTAFQKSIDSWPTPRRSSRSGSLAHPRVPPRPELAPLTRDESSLPRAAAR